MKTNPIIKLMLICWLFAGLLFPVVAQVDEAAQNLYESAGKKQTSKDFKPAPDKLETSFGDLKFELGAFPTEGGVFTILFKMKFIKRQ